MNLPALLLVASLATGPVIPIDDPYPTGDEPGTWDHVFTHQELAEIRTAAARIPGVDGVLTVKHLQILARRLSTPPPAPEIPRANARGAAVVTSGPDAPAWVADLVSIHFAAADVPWALRTVGCETGWTWDPNATNPSSGAAGLFQHLPKYWASRSAAAGYAGASIYDPNANVAVAAWLYYREGPRHWPTCGR